MSTSDGTYSLIVNDHDDAVTGHGWSVGSYTPCADSHGTTGLDFHHDNGINKGRVRANYSLRELAQSGCYELFEWHPGSSYECSRYMPRASPVWVHHSRGITQLSIDQSVGGRQWDSMGFFEFEQGGGYIIISNEGTAECGAATCYWIADAFKLEAVPTAACPPAPPPASPALPPAPPTPPAPPAVPPAYVFHSPPPPLCDHSRQCLAACGCLSSLGVLLVLCGCLCALLFVSAFRRCTAERRRSLLSFSSAAAIATMRGRPIDASATGGAASGGGGGGRSDEEMTTMRRHLLFAIAALPTHIHESGRGSDVNSGASGASGGGSGSDGDGACCEAQPSAHHGGGAGEEELGGVECAICLAEFAAGDAVKRLPCRHAFHAHCIDTWLLGKVCAARAAAPPTCPLCKADALRAPPEPAVEEGAPAVGEPGPSSAARASAASELTEAPAAEVVASPAAVLEPYDQHEHGMATLHQTSVTIV